MITLATSQYFYSHGLQGWLIAGLIATLIGFLIGWLIWRHCRTNAERIERINDELRSRYDELEDNKKKLNQLVNSIS